VSVEFRCNPRLKGATSDRPLSFIRHLSTTSPSTIPYFNPKHHSTNPQPSPSSITRKKHIAQDRKVRTHPALVFFYPYGHEPFTPAGTVSHHCFRRFQTTARPLRLFFALVGLSRKQKDVAVSQIRVQDLFVESLTSILIPPGVCVFGSRPP